MMATLRRVGDSSGQLLVDLALQMTCEGADGIHTAPRFSAAQRLAGAI